MFEPFSLPVQWTFPVRLLIMLIVPVDPSNFVSLSSITGGVGGIGWTTDTVMLFVLRRYWASVSPTAATWIVLLPWLVFV